MKAQNATSPLRLLLVDDHLLFRQSLSSMLSTWPEVEVVSESGDGKECLQLVERFQPDVIVLDITMEGRSGLDLAPRIQELAPESKIIILSMHNNVNYVYRALKIGCKGYVLKSDSIDELKKGIKTVALGKSFLSSGIASDFLYHIINQVECKNNSLSLLTPREKEVCSLLVQGRSTEELADDLCVSPKTIRVHIANLKKKLGCKSRTELILQLRETDEF